MDKFRIGQVVSLIADSNRQGAVVEILPPICGKERYRVFHVPGDIRDYLGEQLKLVELSTPGDQIYEAILSGKWLPPQEFQARLTAARLLDPQIDQLYSLFAGRIQYIPFQFKPLLRFLRSDQPRLFIADEVGVGKTIEAGLILKELQARQRLQNVLVLCPKALVYKWREEMRRFDEDFRILTSESLRYCLDETNMDGVWPTQYSRAIVHLELFRQVQFLEGVRSRTRLQPGLKMLQPPPRFDLFIVDEAHHLRNPATLSNQLARFLCENSTAVLFLSATPVHVGSVNLFNLVNLLRPEFFTDRDVFNQIIEPNRFVTSAMRSVRTQLPVGQWQAEAANAIQSIKGTAWGLQVIAKDPKYNDWDSRLSNKNPLSDIERVQCIRDLEELHSLSYLINRTRRRDIGRFTIREPRTVTVAFTEAQQNLYDAIIEYRRQMLLGTFNPAITELIAITLQRQAASCLPALIPMLNSFIQTGRFSPIKVSDDPEVEEDSSDIPMDMLSSSQKLKLLASSLSEDDPKLEQLLTILKETIHSDGQRKILVFSYFLHTLKYLETKLLSLGFRVRMVTGQTKDEEREDFRSQFRLPNKDENAIDILLSSEVGCEGLDYEFCDRLVNYDIPWNPMRIEQRIGRIDRFGQNSEKVLIFNFVTPGTVEERIFFRCFERLGIFRDTIGDLEEVLGDVIEDLTKIALDINLTPSQTEEKARQISDNLLRLIDEEHRLEEESSAFLGINQSFTSDIQTLIEEGRFVSGSDLINMIDYFVSKPEMGGKITKDEKDDRLYRLRLKKESRQYLYTRFQAEGYTDRTTMVFIRWLNGEEPFLQVTFDQQLALEDRKLPFITPVHPLIKMVVSILKEQTDPLATSLSVIDNRLPEGKYLFICELWEYLGVRSEARMVSMCWDIENDRPVEEISDKLIGLLNRGKENPSEISLTTNSTRFTHLEEFLLTKRQNLLSKHLQRNEFVINRRIMSVDVWYETRMKRLDFEIPNISDERILRMREAERYNIMADHENKLRILESKRAADITTRRIAAGLLEVNHG